MLPLFLPNTRRNFFCLFSCREMTSKVVELQQQMRNNSEDLQDFLRDLGQWTQQMEVKDQQLRNKKAEKKSNESEPPRSVEELKRKIQLIAAEKEKNTSTTAEKKTKTTVSTKPKEKKITSTDYNAWSKFDVERALVDLDKDGRIQESEFIDMDPAMRLQRAVVEKDRGNDFFKVGHFFHMSLEKNSHRFFRLANIPRLFGATRVAFNVIPRMLCYQLTEPWPT